MSKTWKELAEELKLLAEVILEQAKRAFQEGDINTGVLLTKEFRSAIKTAGDLNMIAQGAGELEEDFEEEDIERALGLEDEEDEENLEEEEEEDEIEEEEDEDFDEDFDTDDDGDLEEEAKVDEVEMEPSGEEIIEQKRKIKNQVGESLVTLEQILRGIARKKT
jgi:hypothetical protein